MGEQVVNQGEQLQQAYERITAAARAIGDKVLQSQAEYPYDQFIGTRDLESTGPFADDENTLVSQHLMTIRENGQALSYISGSISIERGEELGTGFVVSSFCNEHRAQFGIYTPTDSEDLRQLFVFEDKTEGLNFHNNKESPLDQIADEAGFKPGVALADKVLAELAAAQARDHERRVFVSEARKARFPEVADKILASI